MTTYKILFLRDTLHRKSDPQKNIAVLLIVVIAGIEDDTQISIYHNGLTLVDGITINRGEAFQYLSTAAPTDISGAFVNSTKTVSVMSGMLI